MKEYYFKGYAVTLFKSVGVWNFIAHPKDGETLRGKDFGSMDIAEIAADAMINNHPVS